MSDGLIPRPRIRARLARGAELGLVALIAPAGAGKTAALGAAMQDRRGTSWAVDGGSEGAIVELEERLRSARFAPGAIFVDRTERCSAVDAVALRALVDRRPAPLLLAGRSMPNIGLARSTAAGRADVVTGDDLAFDDEELAELGIVPSGALGHRHLWRWPAAAGLVRAGHPERISDLLLEEVLDSAPEGLRRQVAAASLAGVGSLRVLEAVAGAIGERLDPVVLRALPGVLVDEAASWIDPAWRCAADRELDPSERRIASEAAVAALVGERELPAAWAIARAEHDRPGIRAVVVAALGVQPPRVSTSELAHWSEDLRSTNDEELVRWRRWMQAAIELARGDPSEATLGELRTLREDFAARDDTEAELGAIGQVGVAARRLGDLAALGELADRCRDLAARGSAEAGGLACLADAVRFQLGGDHDAAIDVLSRPVVDALRADWAAQAHMVRGANLGLVGRFEEAATVLQRAAHLGSRWSRAVAGELLLQVRWGCGDLPGALETAEEVIADATAAGAAAPLELALASRACLLSASADPGARAEIERLRTRRLHSPDAADLLALARVALELGSGRREAASNALAGTPEPHPSSTRARGFVRALRAELEGGEVPARLYGIGGSSDRVRCRLLDRSEAWVGGAPVTASGWSRTRVRELALRLALPRPGGRSVVATDLWPDQPATDALRNLRVNLSHLLDALAPHRRRGEPSWLLVDVPGRLAFADEVEVDVRSCLAALDRLEARGPEDDELLAAAAQLVRHPVGPWLGGDPVGDWAEEERRSFDRRVLAAIDRIGPLALRRGDADLADRLGRRGIAVDPWAEGCHHLVIHAALQRGDVDAARRAARDLISALGDLEVAPTAATVALIARLGVTLR